MSNIYTWGPPCLGYRVLCMVQWYLGTRHYGPQILFRHSTTCSELIVLKPYLFHFSTEKIKGTWSLCMLISIGKDLSWCLCSWYLSFKNIFLCIYTIPSSWHSRNVLMLWVEENSKNDIWISKRNCCQHEYTCDISVSELAIQYGRVKSGPLQWQTKQKE